MAGHRSLFADSCYQCRRHCNDQTSALSVYRMDVVWDNDCPGHWDHSGIDISTIRDGRPLSLFALHRSCGYDGLGCSGSLEKMELPKRNTFGIICIEHFMPINYSMDTSWILAEQHYIV